MILRLELSSLLAFAVVLTARPAAANDLLFELRSPDGTSFGTCLCRLQDVDGDHVPDIAAWVRNLAYGSEVRLYSGRDGHWLRSIGDPETWFGMSIADAGDVDGDGFGDVIIGGGYFPKVFSGSTGAVLFHFHPPTGSLRYGYSVAGIGDVDGDGIPDLAVGDPQQFVVVLGDHVTGGTNGPGYVEIRSGANGSLLRTLHGIGNGVAFGGWVSPALDADGDGVGDIAVAGYLQPFPIGPTTLTLFSGATGAALWEIPFAGVVAPLADVDHDGRGDLVLGDPWRSQVSAISGADGSTLWTHVMRPEAWPGADHYGESVVTAGDIDGDGVPDVLVGARQPLVSAQWTVLVGPGYAQVLSGTDGSCLSTIVGNDLWSRFGTSVSSIEDIDHDGRPELLVSEPGLNRVRVYSGDSRNSIPQNYCIPGESSSGTPTVMGWSGSYSLGANDFVLTVRGAAPGRSGMFLASPRSSASRVDVYSTSDLTFECLGRPPHYIVGSVVTTDPAGTAHCAFDPSRLPSGTVTPGSTWNFQFLYRDPSSPVSPRGRSDALAVTFRP